MKLHSFLEKNNLIDHGELGLIINYILPDSLQGYYFIVKNVDLLTEEKLIITVSDELEDKPLNCQITFDITDNGDLVYNNHIEL
ncbi:MAG TPA: hypothetical protein PKD00_00140 [Burkholderiales bacterium]|nr:hypothetical protein [Burkholderiales bacterium]